MLERKNYKNSNYSPLCEQIKCQYYGMVNYKPEDEKLLLYHG